jgi:hypothetical protein
MSALLSSVGGRNEGALGAACKDEVAGLVADEQRTHDTWGGGGDVHDAHAVRHMVYDPDLAVRPGDDGDRLESDRDAADGAQ